MMGEINQYSSLIGLVLNFILVAFILPLKKSIDELKTEDRALREQMQKNAISTVKEIKDLEVGVARAFVSRAELSETLSTMARQLDRLESRLDTISGVPVKEGAKNG